MQVAIVDADIPYPPNSGKRLRTLNLMTRLASDFEITYIARSTDPQRTREAADFLGDHGINAIIVTAPLAKKAGPSFYGALAKNLASPLPHSVKSHYSQVMQRAVAEHARKHRVNLWQLEWSGYRYAIAGQKGPVVLQAHNVDALIWKRYAASEGNLLKRLYAHEQWRKVRRFEGEAFRAASRVVLVSEADATVAREWYGEFCFDVVDNGVDAQSFANLRPDAEARRILFVGALDWRPNLDALSVLLDSIFPLVRARIPDAKLMVVGRSPPHWLRSRTKDMPGVLLAADVPDVRPYFAKSCVLAVPLRIGGGSRLKILEALAAGLPVVATPVGVEGLHLGEGCGVTTATSERDTAAALIAILRDPREAFAKAEHGRQAVTARYDWQLLANRLSKVWEAACRAHRHPG